MEDSVAEEWGTRNFSVGKFSPYLTNWEKLTIELGPLKESKNYESKVTKNVKPV